MIYCHQSAACICRIIICCEPLLLKNSGVPVCCYELKPEFQVVFVCRFYLCIAARCHSTVSRNTLFLFLTPPLRFYCWMTFPRWPFPRFPLTFCGSWFSHLEQVTYLQPYWPTEEVTLLVIELVQFHLL